jgi:hypothetical protein
MRSKAKSWSDEEEAVIARGAQRIAKGEDRAEIMNDLIDRLGRDRNSIALKLRKYFTPIPSPRQAKIKEQRERKRQRLAQQNT